MSQSADAEDPAWALIERHRAGDAAAAEELVMTLRARVLTYALYWMGPKLRARHEPEDLVQEAWIELLRALRRNPPREPRALYAWISTIVRRTAGRRARAGEGEPIPAAALATPGSEGGIEAFLPACLSTPSVRAHKRDEARRAVEALESLPEDLRQTVWMKIYEQRSSKEIGEATGRSESAVRMVVLRACRELDHRFPDHSGSEPARWM
jgi:RNA polymerase sigma factor (sigma-70 family)